MLFTKFHYFKQHFEPVLLSTHVHGYYFSIHISRSVISRCIDGLGEENGQNK